LREEVVEVPNLDSTVGILLRSLALELGNLHDEVYARREYEELSVHRRGDRLRCRLGGESVDGTFLGFDHRGFLRLEVEGRERVMNAGEVYE
jgi:biotin-(acetyl-CoA carboxylase) ligase